MRKLICISLMLVSNALLVGVVCAAEIQVITSGAFAEALKDLSPEYEKQSSNKVIISYGSSMGLHQILFRLD